MVGTFYGAPEPGAKPYVSVGSTVTKGQIVCIIEAMKIMNEIEAEIRASCGRSAPGRAAGRIRPGPLPGRSQWLTAHRAIPRERGRVGAGAPSRAPPRPVVQLQDRPAEDGPGERLRPAPQGRPSADGARQRRARAARACRRCKPEDLQGRSAEQIMTPRQVEGVRREKEADFAIGVPGVGRFRTNIYQQRGTLAFAFRAIPYEVQDDPRAEPAAGARGDRAASRAAWCWSPASPARASPPRSRR